jgi:hypothetical protein
MLRVLSGSRRRTTGRWFVLGALAAAAPGCSSLLIDGGNAPSAAAAPSPPADPVAAFAAAAVPGSETVAALPEAGGGGARLRLLRSYAAASGRECREVLIGTGMTERTRLVCRQEGGGWAAARPLLSGGGARP